MVVEVRRGGATARYWSGRGRKTKLLHNAAQKDIQIRFNIASKGGGTTNVMVRVTSESFDLLARHMIEADRTEAIDAFEYAMRRVGAR